MRSSVSTGLAPTEDGLAAVRVFLRASGAEDADAIVRALELGEADLPAGLRLSERHEELGAFDAVLAAAAFTRDAATLVSADRVYVAVRGLRFVELAGIDVSALD